MKLVASTLAAIAPNVAPCAGAWIETLRPLRYHDRYDGRPLRGGVD